MSKFTSALLSEDVQIKGHITLCFCDAEKSGKFSTFAGKGIATIIDVQYWERVDLTVLILDCKLANERHEYYKNLGYTYDYEFIPHISIGKSNLVKENQHLKGDRIVVGSEYARIY